MYPASAPRRIALLAIGLGLTGLFHATPLHAHPLPGSVLIFAQADSQLSLTITVPLAELALATAVPDALPEGPLDPALANRLAGYFTSHMTVAQQGGPDLTFTLIRAATKPATDDHLGSYTLVILDFTADLPATQPVQAPTLTLTLTYSAVMHRVRSHVATVYLRNAGGAPIGIGRIRPDLQSGLTRPLTIAIAT